MQKHKLDGGLFEPIKEIVGMDAIAKFLLDFFRMAHKHND